MVVVVVIHRTRSLVSILERSPASLLPEVVIVDSSLPALSPALVVSRLGLRAGRVRVVRSEGLGTMVGRNLGAEACSSPVLVFLPSSVEVQEGWLEPLLVRLAGDRCQAVLVVVAVVMVMAELLVMAVGMAELVVMAVVTMAVELATCCVDISLGQGSCGGACGGLH